MTGETWGETGPGVLEEERNRRYLIFWVDRAMLTA
jgi:hypothetical protein